MFERVNYILSLLCISMLLLVVSIPLTAQPDTLYICNPGDALQLQGPEGQFLYRWSPPLAFDNPYIARPVVRPMTASTFVVQAVPEVTTDNLIVNADFSKGNEDFFSEYPFSQIINIQGVYGISTSAANLNPTYFENCPDHTNGTGMMMVVDGSPTPNEKVWCQTVSVQPNTDYAFSTWLTSVNPNNPAELQFSINGLPLGEVFVASSNVCEWRQFYELWYSGTTSEAEICIINQNTNPQGNDFALDDFAFYELDEIIYDTTVVLIEAVEAARDRRVFIPNAFTPNFDGANDLFRPYLGKGAIQLLEFKIFDRWGQLVFSRSECGWNDPACAWDGRSDDRELPMGVYLYYVKVRFADEHIELYSGDVTLIK